MVASLPSTEIAAVSPTTSFVSISEALAAPISSELNGCLRLLLDWAAAEDVAIKCVVRPELFVGDKPAAWLRDRLGSTTDHICISDGTSLKTMPGLRNHLFFYRPSSMDWLETCRLLHRAPEVLRGLRSQINSSIAVTSDGAEYRPTTIRLRVRTARKLPPPTAWALQINSDWIEGGVAKTFGTPVILTDKAFSARRLCYIPTSGAALQDAAFCYAVAVAIRDACFDPETLLVLRLVSDSGRIEAAKEIAKLLLASLRQSGVLLPQICRDNIVVSAGDISEELAANFERIDVVLHGTFEYWSYTKEFFNKCYSVRVFDQSWSLRVSANYTSTTLQFMQPSEALEDHLGVNSARALVAAEEIP